MKTQRNLMAGVMMVLLLVGVTTSRAWQLTDQSKLAKAQQEYVVALRHELHQNFTGTRWSNEETQTLARIRKELEALQNAPGSKLKIVKIVEGKGGLWVDLDFDARFDRILFRADVDALPVTEATGLPFASTHSGTSHACGHDTHVAMLLGFVRALTTGLIQPKHNLRLVFQRAEENPVSKNGGQTLVEDDKVLDGTSSVYGLHIWVGSEGLTGTFISYPGAILANNDQFRVQINCKGGHVASPEDGCNAIDVATDLHVAMRGFDRRYLGAMEPASIVPAITLAGTAGQANVRPAYADIWYSTRTFLDQKGRQKLETALRQKVAGVAAAYPDAKVEFTFVYGYPATINDAATVARMAGILKAIGFEYGEIKSLGGEDFSYYLQKRPGADFLLTAWQPGTGGHHSPTFNPDESVLWQGVYYWILLATR